MKTYAIIVTLLLLLSLFLHYDREVERGITVKDLELENQALKSIVKRNDIRINESATRERFKDSLYFAYRDSLETAIQLTEIKFKRYRDEQKRKTGILSDSSYNAVINGLFPGR